ncbi:MAG: DUF4215 domain-containing protein [Polyangiaceae bacterium]|nr:DUF4215 domain-containing protein [Polyangiaceae bacterium]
MRISTRLVLAATLASIPMFSGCGGEVLEFPTGTGGSGGTGGTGAGAGTGGDGATGATPNTGGTGASTSVGGTGGTGGSAGICGDGIVDPSEQCDGGDLNGETCKDYGFSNPDGLTCTGSCLINTSGCKASCDGMLVETGEECDGADLNGHNCTEQGFVNPDGVSCTMCTPDYSGCMAACGNGTAEPGELCDGSDLGMASCADFGYVNPAGLGCDASCKMVDSSGCTAACNGTLEPDEECDGMNLNGFDCTQLGYVDPMGAVCDNCALNTSGCKATCGNNKVEPGEQCDDGNTVDGDGCSATCTAGGVSCADATPISLASGSQTITGTTVGGGVASGTCASAGPGRVYAVTAQAEGFLTASLTRSGTAYQSVLFARTTCADAGSQLLCADSKDPANATSLLGGEVISFPVSANQTVYIFVDGAGANDAGNYELVLDLSAGTNCNDPIPVRIEKGTPMTLLGFTNGKTQSSGGSCGGGGTGFGAEDVVYNVNFVGAGNVSASIDAAGTNYNSVLYTRGGCNDGFSQIGCDNAGGNGGENLTFNPNGDTSVYVWVDGSTGANGYYTLILTPAP